jgi:DNA repair exonuclease SbcCD ATPase subunit
MQLISETVERKFIDSVDLSNLEIETDTGWQPITSIHKTVPYQVWVLTTETGKMLECADDHIVFDENFNEVFVKSLVPNKSYIQTSDGLEKVITVYEKAVYENMFDITVNSNDHRYYTNNILSHNTTLLQGLSYVLFGSPINNIRKDNLINRTNAKGMMVTLEFIAKGINYKIERGRKPNILRFYVNDNLQANKDDKNEAQGENKETQLAIEYAIGMTYDMFKHIVVLNTYTEPFLSMKSNDQRNIIEQLLGITLLSEKADLVREKIRINKELIQQEEFRNKAIEEANKRVQEQIDSLKRRQKLWTAKHSEDLNKLVLYYDELSNINIEAELSAHKNLSLYNERKKAKEQTEALVARQLSWKQKLTNDIGLLEKEYDKLSHIDITKELENHRNLADWNSKKLEADRLTQAKLTFEKNLVRDTNNAKKLEDEILTLEQNRCYACGQDFHDENHVNVLNNKKALLDTTKNDITQTQNELEKIKKSLDVLGLGDKPNTYYKTEVEAIKHSSELERLLDQIKIKKNETDPFADQIDKSLLVDLGPMPITHYDTEAEAIEHKSILSNLLVQIEQKDKEVDPYHEQIEDMEKKALQEVSFEKINELTKFGDHLKFLLDVLTSKDSFIRKKIIDQNISYLNSRLTTYLDKIGLPHNVIFKNDLSVEITELGRELDFYNLSRGEMNRLILALSFAFRDVWENLYSPINALFIDELIDSGMDTIGVENSLAILKNMSRNRNKSIWLVSHKEELVNRVDKVLRVVKEGGFTSYHSATEEVK